MYQKRKVLMTAKTNDYDEIVRVIRLYLAGCNDNNVKTLKEAFDENAWIFYVDADGVLHKTLISECFEEWATPPGWGINGRIVSVTQMGDAAGVVLLFGDDWIDFHSLVRVNGAWKITNKTATHSTR